MNTTEDHAPVDACRNSRTPGGERRPSRPLTPSELGGSPVSMPAGIGIAAWQFEDSLLARGPTRLDSPDKVSKHPTRPEARELHLKATQAERWYNKALLGMVALSVFEVPSWCDTSLVFPDFKTASERCSVNSGEVMLSGIEYVPPSIGIVIELIFMAVLARRFLLERELQVNYFKPIGAEYHSLARLHAGLAMLLLELADIIYFLFLHPRWRIAFLARTGYLCLLPACQNLFRCIRHCLGQLNAVAGFLVGVLVFFAWITMTGFSGIEDGAEGFGSFGESLNSLFVAGVSDDFVGVFLASYTTYRWVGIMWLFFLLVVHLLLLSLVLDTLVAAYRLYAEEEEEKTWLYKIGGMTRAFSTLSRAVGGDGGDESDIPRDGFLKFIEELCRSPRVNKISEANADILFKAIDDDKSGYIDKTEFCDICDVIQFQFWSTRKHSCMKDRFPDLWASEKYVGFREWVAEKFDSVMTKILLVNFALVVTESCFDLNHVPEPAWMDWAELAFSLIYVGEVAVKLMVVSWPEYTSDYSDCFDFATTWLLLLSSLLQRFLAGKLSTYMNMLRLLRLLRVVKQLKNITAVQFMIRCISRIVVEARDMMTFLGVVVFFFTTLAVQVFGGELYEQNGKLEGTEYHENRWFVLNCNDFPSAFGLWFVMLLQEYQPSFTDAVAATSSVPCSWLIFPIFYIFAVSIAFELSKAFTIEVYMKIKSKNKREAEEKREAANAKKKESRNRVEAILEVFQEGLGEDKSLHYGDVGDLPSAKEQKERIVEALKKIANEENGDNNAGHEDASHGRGHGHH